MTPIGQPCACEPMTWLYFVLVQSVFVFVVFTLTGGTMLSSAGARVTAPPAALVHRGT